MLNKHLPDKALDILDEACARKSTMQVKLEKDDTYKKLEKDIINIEKKIEKAIESQDYFKAAEFKEKEEKMKKEMKAIRSNKNMPQHLRPTINSYDIGVVLSEKTGIPVSVVNQSEIDRLKQLDKDLRKHILGQEEAVEAIVKTITRNRLSMIEKTKPIGSFLFLGPSGVGKTYLAKLIAKNYF
jgi:ATP-dependent Clp protease ATP-binding subunit ClpC